VVLGTGRRGSGQIPARAGGGNCRRRAWGGAGVARGQIRLKSGWWGSQRSHVAVAAAASRGAPGSGEVEAGDNG
jgi:hypothetical protein